MLPAGLTRDLGRVARQLGAAPPVSMPDDPVPWIRQAAGLEPDPWQAGVLRSTASRLLLLCARQTGKSTTVGWLVAWRAASRPRHRVGLIAPTERQARNLLTKVMETLATAAPVPPLVQHTNTMLRLANGSTVLALPGDRPDTVRGLTLDLAAIDEAAFVKADVLRVLMPMLATTGGTLALLSTPSGPVGPFYDAWQNADDGWERVTVKAEACPRITPEFLESARRRLGAAMFAAEFECSFLRGGTGIFDPLDLEAAFGPAPEPGGLHWAEALMLTSPAEEGVQGAEEVLA